MWGRQEEPGLAISLTLADEIISALYQLYQFYTHWKT